MQKNVSVRKKPLSFLIVVRSINSKLEPFLPSKKFISFDAHIKNKSEFDVIMAQNPSIDQFKDFKLSKTDPVSATVYDILTDVKSTQFIIRPDYQRSEVSNSIQKASYLLESSKTSFVLKLIAQKCSITKNTTNILLFMTLFTTNIENEAFFRNRITLLENLETVFRLRQKLHRRSWHRGGNP